jgi:hypothetical protein
MLQYYYIGTCLPAVGTAHQKPRYIKEKMHKTTLQIVTNHQIWEGCRLIFVAIAQGGV